MEILTWDFRTWRTGVEKSDLRERLRGCVGVPRFLFNLMVSEWTVEAERYRRRPYWWWHMKKAAKVQSKEQKKGGGLARFWYCKEVPRECFLYSLTACRYKGRKQPTWKSSEITKRAAKIFRNYWEWGIILICLTHSSQNKVFIS